MKDKELEYFKKELNKVLEEQQDRESVLSVKKSAFMINEICKSLFNPAYTSDALEVMKAGRGHLVPKQITTTNKKTGKTYTTTVWVNPNKQNGLKKYTEQDSKGAKIAIGKLMKKIDACNSVEELYSLVLRNKSRFSDNEGKPLPIVEKLHDCVEAKGSSIEIQAKKKENAKKLTSSRSARLDGGEEKQEITTAELKAKKAKLERWLANKTRSKKDLLNNIIMRDEYKKELDAINAELEKREPTSYTGKLRAKLKDNLKSSFGLHKNKATGIEANLSGKSVDKMSSEKAIEKSKANGFTVEQHFEVANQIVSLFENAELTSEKPDKNGSENIKSIKRFDCDVTLADGKKANAHITVKESVQNGHKIYSVEVMTLEQKKSRSENNSRAGVGLSHKNGTQSDTSSVTHSDDSVNVEKVLGENASSRLNSGVAAIRKHYESTKSVLGGKKSVVLPNGEKIKCRYKIVEADAPTASHNEVTFASSDNFPTNSSGQNINDRDYQHDEDAKMSVITIGNNYNALALQDLPVVTKDGIVVSGNNRTMSSKLAAKNGRDKAYLAELKEQLSDGEFNGLDEKDLEGFEHPRLILEIEKEHEGKYTTEEFAQFNKDTKKTMNNVEKAVKLTKTLNAEKIQSIADSIQNYETMGELYQDKQGGQDFVQKLIKAGIIGENEKAQFLQSDGLLNDTGKDFVETVLVGTILDENNIRGCDSEGGKSIRKKLLRAILPLVENKGTGKEYSFNKELNEAVSLILEVNSNKEFSSIDAYTQQQDMFGGGNFDPFAVQFAKILKDEGEKKFAERMKNLNAGCRESSNGAMDIFLGGVESKETLLSRWLDIKDSVKKSVKKAFDSFFAQWTA